MVATDQVYDSEPAGHQYRAGSALWRASGRLTLDWERFFTSQTADFMAWEIESLKRLAPTIPITTNLMGTYPGLDSFRFQDVLDVASYDCYPRWGVPRESEDEQAVITGFAYDMRKDAYITLQPVGGETRLNVFEIKIKRK